MATKKSSRGKTPRKAVARTADVEPTPDQWPPTDDGGLAPFPRAAFAKLAAFGEANGTDRRTAVDADAEALAEAWSAVSFYLAHHVQLMPEAARVARRVLMPFAPHEDLAWQGPDLDKETVAAVDVAMLALAALDGDEHAAKEVQKMARARDPHQGAEHARRRERIKDVVRYLGSDNGSIRGEMVWDEALDAAMREAGEDSRPAGPGDRWTTVSEERWRQLSAEHLSFHLGEIDPRMRLDESTGVTLLRLYWRSNGVVKLAANWAWRAGLESKKAETSEAPKHVLDRYRDAVKKRAKRSTKRTRR
jgi:hypothetical protein